jgi:hypothetical protein
MQLFMTAVAVVAGMTFSLAIALLVEELIFGQVFRLIFAKQIFAKQVLAQAQAVPSQADGGAAVGSHRPKFER